MPTDTTQQQVQQFYDALAITTGRVRLLTLAGGYRQQQIIPVAAAPTHAADHTPHGNVWLSTSTFGDGPTGVAADVIAVHALSVDLDAKPDGMGSLERCNLMVDTLADLIGREPAVVIATGHGVQAHWPIDDVDAHWEPDDDTTRARWVDLFRRFGALTQHIAATHGGKVDSAFGIERVWRAPGTVNTKPGQPPVPAAIIDRAPTYDAITYDEADDLIRAHLHDEPTTPPIAPAVTTHYDAMPPKVQARVKAWTDKAVEAVATDLRSGVGSTGYGQGGWDNNATLGAYTLVGLAESPWCPLTHEAARAVLLDNMPTDDGFPRERVAAKFDRAATRRGAGVGRTPPAWLTTALAAAADTEPTDPGGTEDRPRPDLNVGNAATMADWLADNLGTGHLSGVFTRAGELVYTPRIGEAGYAEVGHDAGDHDGPAQVHPLSAAALAARVQYGYTCHRFRKEGKGDDAEWKAEPALFPLPAATTAVSAPDKMRNVRPLRGVTHSPTVRADGTLLTTPGYDPASGLLYLPAGRGAVVEVPEHPGDEDVAEAAKTVNFMLQDFAFVTPSDRAGYIGLLLTPLLRNLAPSPYKLAVIEAHQPGSGKTFLARALMTVHGGVFRSEMPREEAELHKQITTILDVTTGPVVIFDNATGTLRSSILAGLLTSPVWTDRRLGTAKEVSAVNDRLWVVTGNNLALGGDLVRRSMRVRIDPGVPNPHLRTGFAIADFEGWVRDNRALILWSLLVMVRHWVASGRPLRGRRGADSFGSWIATVDGILAASGVEGTFDDPGLVEEGGGDEDAEWWEFLDAIYTRLGDRAWTAADILGMVNDSTLATNPTMIPYDALPTDLAAKRRPGEPLGKLSKSLGWWLRNRAGRWAGGEYKVVVASSGRMVTWRVVRWDPQDKVV